MRRLRYTYVKRQSPGGNPIANALVVVAGAIVITAALILGFFAFLALGALILVSAAAVSLRLWWLRRRSLRQGSARARDPERPAADVIEGEFHVLGEERESP